MINISKDFGISNITKVVYNVDKIRELVSSLAVKKESVVFAYKDEDGVENVRELYVLGKNYSKENGVIHENVTVSPVESVDEEYKMDYLSFMEFLLEFPASYDDIYDECFKDKVHIFDGVIATIVALEDASAKDENLSNHLIKKLLRSYKKIRTLFLKSVNKGVWDDSDARKLGKLVLDIDCQERNLMDMA